ncbi:hypothetical protein CHS0354_040143 [Potamilus streckersoni]|uniref:Uncharacterized protein n=1 Tax=Potamilus streckersoni TaxID=2493646 RepID=A0AAE0SSH3_9BIVA|nr:hypothetical protein CHS0354_040143 [Potamilus streckersoni]
MTFVYRLAWPGQNFVTCNESNCDDFIVRNKHNVSYEQRLKNLRWKCVTGCKGVLQTTDSMTFTSINKLLEDQWEMAEGSFKYIFNYTMDDQVTFQVPFERETMIDIFTFDGDGDQVKCRWGNNSQFPKPSKGFLLDEERCRIHISPMAINGFSVGDLYHLSLTAEDFVNHPVKWSSRVNRGPFSSVPFIISVRIGSKPNVSTSGPTFNERETTFPFGMIISSLQYSWNARIDLSVYGTGHTIIETGPRNMIFEDLEKNYTTRVASFFNRTVENTGINIICVASYTSDG